MVAVTLRPLALLPTPYPLTTAILAGAILAAAALSCAPAPRPAARPVPTVALPTPATRAERTRFRETSTDSDVTAFLSALARRTGRIGVLGLRDTALGAAPLEVSAYDSSTNGGAIPFVVAARPAAVSARDAHAKGRPVVFIEAGAGGDDGAGTDAVLAVVRDLLARPAGSPNVLDSILLVVVPQANPDAVVPGMSSRGLTIISPIAAPDTDLVAITARETRTTLSIIHQWRPDVIIDLRASDAGGAAYPLTLGPPTHPAALFTGAFTRDSLIPALRLALADQRHHLETFGCGSIVPPWTGTDSLRHAYEGCDHRARTLTNYAGLLGRVGLLARTNTQDSLAVQVRAATAFLEEALSAVAAHGADIVERANAADTTIDVWGSNPDASPDVPLRSSLAPSGPTLPILVDESPRDTTARRPRTPRPRLMPVHDQVIATLRRRLPVAYALDPGDSATVRLLQRHGLTVQRHVGEQRIKILERFILDSVTADSTWHDADHPPRLSGHWLRVIGSTTLPAGTVTVPCAQPLGLLAMMLLEPESEDGLVVWHQFDSRLRKGGTFPVAKLID